MNTTLKVGQMLKTINGRNAKIVWIGKDKMLVKIFSVISSQEDRVIKYNLDGTSPFASDLNGFILDI